MKKDKLLQWMRIAGYAMILVFIIIGFFIARKGQEAFMEYLKEDGLVENLTALFLLAASGTAVFRCFRAPLGHSRYYYVTWGLIAFLFFFAFGEEISWGQRIFNIGTSAYFENNNLQHETNLHNLVIGGVKINKLIFSQLMSILMACYFILLRPLAQKTGFFNRMVNLFDVPLPRWGDVIAMIISIILTSQYHLMKAAELREIAFAVIMFLIFVDPARIAAKSETK